MNSVMNQSRIRNVVTLAIVIEEGADGIPIVTTWGDKNAATMLANPQTMAIGNATVATPVELPPAKPTPTVAKTEPTKTPTPNAVPLDEHAALVAEAKSLGMPTRGLHLCKSETLRNKIAAFKGQPQAAPIVAPAASQTTTAPTPVVHPPKPSFAKKAQNNDGRWYPRKGASPVEVYKKDKSAIFSGYAVETIDTAKGYKGILFLRPDDQTTADMLHGFCWAVPNDMIVRYLG